YLYSPHWRPLSSTLFPYTTLFRSDPDAPETKALGGIVAPPTFTWASSHYEPDYALDLTRPRKEPRPERSEGSGGGGLGRGLHAEDRKSTRLNSSHVKISYAVFCLK